MTFNPQAVADSIDAQLADQQTTASAKALRNRLDPTSRRKLDELRGKLKKAPSTKNKRPTITLKEELIVRAFSSKAAQNVTTAERRENMQEFHFPAGATIKDVKTSSEFCVEHGSTMLHLYRAPGGHWHVRSHSGFRGPSGRAAGQRSMGKGPDKSFS